jgi:hypothetical protein
LKPTIPVTVSRHATEALDEGDRAAASFSEFLRGAPDWSDRNPPGDA